MDSVLKGGKLYYSQVLLEESKYNVKEKIRKYINDDVEISDEEVSNKKSL